jgi:hypothetical protein
MRDIPHNTIRHKGTHDFDISIERCIRCGKNRRACDDYPKCTGQPESDNRHGLPVDNGDD